jgi:hypothetical protein
MAVLPCQVGFHQHRLRNVNVYASWYVGSMTQRHSARFCPGHWSEIESGLSQFEVDTDSGALSDPTCEGLCLTCLKPVTEGSGQVFLTSYPTKDQRKDYWARIHTGCNLPGLLGSYFPHQ